MIMNHSAEFRQLCIKILILNNYLNSPMEEISKFITLTGFFTPSPVKWTILYGPC